MLNKKLNTNPKNIEIFEDLVQIKDLVISLFITTIITFGSYLLAPSTPPNPLIFGLMGSFIGFIICCIIIKPKRKFN